jgi:precorrin-4/cobalt-precorrin-4 C11-methyltransferase
MAEPLGRAGIPVGIVHGVSSAMAAAAAAGETLTLSEVTRTVILTRIEGRKAIWPDEERVLRGTLADIAEQCRAVGIDRQAMILASPALGARTRTDIEMSRLYAPEFGHGFRRAERTPDT